MVDLVLQLTADLLSTATKLIPFHSEPAEKEQLNFR